jgi:hypothetical protein
MATDKAIVPFVGGEVFNPANFVRITNLDAASTIGRGAKAKQVIQGRYNGKDYLFPYGQPVNVHLEVARHCFGLGQDDKSAALSRLGWARTSDELPDAIERLSNIRFEDLPELMEASRFKAPEIAHASGLVKGDDAAEGGPVPPSNAHVPAPKKA